MKLRFTLQSVLLLSLAVLIPCLVIAQGTDKIITKGEESYRYHYFQNSTKVSTVWHMPADGKQGYAAAYDKVGKEIYRGVLSRMHMIRSVEFSYHPNGAVSVAHERWHPDAGIQSGGTRYTFDENGIQTGKSEDMDPHNPLQYPGRTHFDPPPSRPVVEPKPSTPRMADLFYTNVLIVNETKRPIRIRVVDHQQQHMSNDQFLPTEIASNDSLTGQQYRRVNAFGSHDGLLEFELSAKKEKWLRGVSLHTESPDCMEIDRFHRNCRYVIKQDKNSVR